MTVAFVVSLAIMLVGVIMADFLVVIEALAAAVWSALTWSICRRSQRALATRPR